MVWLVKASVIIISLFVFFKMSVSYYRSKGSFFDTPKKLPLLFTGFIANVFDTIGLGSFAVVVACNKQWNLVDDKKLPGTLNGQSVLPAMLQSVLFLQFVEMDVLMLVVFVLAACVGGVACGFLVARMDKQSIRLVMSIGFLGIGFLILGNQLHVFPFAGDATTLSTTKLLIGVPAMVLVGMLPAIGVGAYVPTQIVLFFLGLSPLVAFPIMTTSGAIVQSMTALAFVVRKEIAFEETFYMMFAGVFGVIVAVQLVAYVPLHSLRWLLLCVVLYNSVITWQTYQREMLVGGQA